MQDPYMMRRGGFTLVEMLVVIAILAVLAALLFPTLSTARANARRTACMTNLRQIGLALHMYREDYGDLPPQLSFVHPTYTRDARLFLCPSDRLKGQHEGNSRLEGKLYLPSGVSYEYVPQWQAAQELGWWNAPPSFGPGRWDDLTPITICNWHWATAFRADWSADRPGSRGWRMTLLMGGTVRRFRVETPLEQFTPDLLR